MKIDSKSLSGDFLKFPNHLQIFFLYDVVPETANPHIPVNSSFVKCIDLLKREKTTNVNIRIHTSGSVTMPQDGYSLKKVDLKDSHDIINGSTLVYALTNVNGHFFIPISSNSILDDLVELTRRVKNEICIRVVLYEKSHDVTNLLNRTQKKIENIRKPRTKTVWEGSGEDRHSRTETYYSKEKGGEFDNKSDDLIEKMRDYSTTQLCSVYVFMRNTSDVTIIGSMSLSSVSPQFDSLKFVPITPLKEKVGWFKKEDISIVQTMKDPIFFDVQKTIEKCAGGNYFSDGWGSKRKNNPIVCIKSKIVFPFSSQLVAKTVSSKEIADKVNEKDFFDIDSNVDDLMGKQSYE